MPLQPRTTKALHDLIATCNDAAEGFGKAAKGVHDADLSNWLTTASADRERFGTDLSRALVDNGEAGGLDLHEGGIFHKGWIDLESRLRSTEPHLRSKDDFEIVRECIAGDTGSLNHYDHTLEQELPDDLRSLILEQRTTVVDQLAYLQTRATARQHGHSA
jgi:uncharacterized protein (TIGR02284 family)